MMKTTGKNGWLALLASMMLFSASPLTADTFCGDMYDSCCSYLDDVQVGADFLFWQTCADDLDYAILFNGDPVSATGTSTGTFRNLDPSYEPGFRIWLGKRDLWCGWDLWASYTWFKSSESGTTDRGGNQTLFPTVGIGGLDLTNVTHAKGSYALTYQAFDVLFGHAFCWSECQVFQPFFGIQGVKIQQKRTLDARNTAASEQVRWDSDTKALGLEIGSYYDWSLGCGFHFFGIASLSVLAGHDDANHYLNVTDTVPYAYSFKDDSCICIPGMHLAAGFSYSQCWCGKDVSLRIGYEFTDWWNVTRSRRWPVAGNSIGISTSPKDANLVLHGLFVGLGVGF